MTDNQLVALDYEGRRIRTFTMDGEPWFVAADVAAILDIKDVSAAVERLDDDEHLTMQRHAVEQLAAGYSGFNPENLFPKGGAPTLVVISESGFYGLVLRSRKPEARPFQRWVTKVVIPTIRKHGGYILGTEYLSPERQAVYHEATRQLGMSAAEEQEARDVAFVMMKPGRRLTTAQRQRAIINHRNNAAMQIVGGN